MVSGNTKKKEMIKAMSDECKGDSGTAAIMRDWIGMLCDGGKGKHAGASTRRPQRHSPEVPFSFVCGARSSREWIKREGAACETGEWRNKRREHILRWSDPESALSCVMELTEYSDFPAMEWVVRLRCGGTRATEPLHDFRALDTSWKRAGEGEMPELRRAYGSDGRHDDFQHVRDELRQSMWDAGRTIRMDSAANAAFRKARNGSPSFLISDQRPSATWLPFFNLRTGSDGLFIALGRSGRWFAEFAHDGKGETAVSAGMEHLELRLRPGEEIRSPRVALLYWQGEPTHAHNSWRRFVLKHHSPSAAGQPVQVPVCNGSWGGTPTPGHLEAIEVIRRLRPYFLGDYHPLTPCVFDMDSWVAYQLILPEKQEGAILAFRRPESKMTSGCFRLQGLDAAQTYLFEDADGGTTMQVSGGDLMEKGLALSMDTPRASRLLFFSIG